jgi:diguanylate cyclase (GGDEF)-like protein
MSTRVIEPSGSQTRTACGLEEDDAPICVLLIEDDPIDAAIVSRCLRQTQRDFEVHLVRSLADAVLSLHEREFQLIITDLGLPDCSGTETVRRIGREARGTPILVLSDGEEQLVGLSSVRGGAQDFLPKSRLDAPNLQRAIDYGLERRRIELRLERMAMSDGLTGAHNRAFFDRFIADTQPAGLTILWLDLDKFKWTNDRYGHAVGDALLKGVVERLQARLRLKDLVCRLGGAEFGVILRDVDDQDAAVEIAEELSKLLEQPYELGEGVTLRQTVSIGVAWFGPQDQGSSEDLVRAADTAMYAAKAAGRATVAVHTLAMAEERRVLLELDALLIGALARGEVSVTYQPIVDLESNEVVALEAFGRWVSPELGDVPSDVFIPRAVELGVVEEIGGFVLDQALAFLAGVRRFRSDMVISVNVSGRQLEAADFQQTVATALLAHGLPGKALCVEVTESELLHQRKECVRSLLALSEMGVGISLDDFGTGFSSLTNLLEIPVSTMKIAKSFVALSLHDGPAQRLIRGLIAMGQSLGIRVTAEGIETQAQRDYMFTAGCATGQGRGLAGPLAEVELRSLLQAA